MTPRLESNPRSARKAVGSKGPCFGSGVERGMRNVMLIGVPIGLRTQRKGIEPQSGQLRHVTMMRLLPIKREELHD